MFVVSVATPSIVEGESVVGWIVGASEVEDLTLEQKIDMRPFALQCECYINIG